MWTEHASVSDATPHVFGLTVLPPDVTGHANLAEIREVLRTAFVWSPVEFRLLAVERERRMLGPRCGPGLPSWMVEHAADIQSRVGACYAKAVSAAEIPQSGVYAVMDAIEGAYLAPWLPPTVHGVLLAPVRSLLGPEREGGMGPRYAEVAGILLNAHGLNAARAAVFLASAAGRETSEAEAEVRRACEITGRSSALRRARESLRLLLDGLTDEGLSATAARRCEHLGTLAAGAVIARDVLTGHVYRDAVAPWRGHFPEAARDTNG